ncbi:MULTISPECIES: hypothetical protein [unclassified Mucilaginibacter]|uniref:hypothetical protein n=1 Tax=unclassified Mucilaginibacter TaxID=2617802 RepID=UPI002AC8DCD7|nr:MULTISPECIES: hypothetical protein [unclassified Mucilaginibacter]MEB0263123.1 hypothetical protein [Mucilaginibacter sp. 10I4]MEB0280249.1 hypothetical protein [Mucilaginibacter sp. 10B2]MEB0300194.1 hypothetical protein [Mucilaginibacter sp. 5C4]WPX25552.1 hypothetical protein RHM67_09765 [Mucilaginibacter sp. 5C4]
MHTRDNDVKEVVITGYGTKNNIKTSDTAIYFEGAPAQTNVYQTFSVAPGVSANGS